MEPSRILTSTSPIVLILFTACTFDAETGVVEESTDNLTISEGGGILTIDATYTDVLTQLDPCIQPIGFSLRPVFDATTLVATAQSSSYGDSESYALRSHYAVTDSEDVELHSATEVRAITQKHILDGNTSAVSLGLVVAGWDGVELPSTGSAILADNEPLTMSLTIEIVHVTTTGGATTFKPTPVDAITVSSSALALPANSACQAWVALAPALGTGTTGTVEIDGYSTGIRPKVTWRGGVPSRILGELASRQAGEREIDMMKRFLQANPALFGNPTAASLDGLHEDRTIVGPDGLQDTRLRQRVPGSDILVRRGLWTATVDSLGNLVRVGGELAIDVPSLGALPSRTTSDTQALALVEADLVQRGEPVVRDKMLVGEQLLEGTGGYQRAIQVLVDPVEGDNDTHAYEYLVSSTTQQIISAETLENESPVPVDARVWARDPAMLVTLDDPNRALLLGQRDVMLTTRSILVDDDGNDIELRDSDGDATVHKVTEKFLYDDVPKWPTGSLYLDCVSPNPKPTIDGGSMEIYACYEALTSYQSIQQFWLDYALQWWDGSPGSFAAEALLLDSNEDDMDGLGLYQPRFAKKARILINRGQFTSSTPVTDSPADLWTPSHEAFHHFDQNLNNLDRGGDDPGDGKRMPGALNEGLAVWASMFTVEEHVSTYRFDAFRAIFCIAGILKGQWKDFCGSAGKFFSMPGWEGKRARPVMDNKPSTWPRWPDCRDPNTVDDPTRCYTVGPPGAPRNNTFTWRAQASNYESEYVLIAHLMLDAWETSANNVLLTHGETDAEDFVELFPFVTLRAMSFVDDNPSFVEYRDAVLDAVSVFWRTSPSRASSIRAGVADAFARHGVDVTLERYCAGPSTNECH